MSVTAAQGFAAAGVAAGIKVSGRRDLALVVNTGPRRADGPYGHRVARHVFGIGSEHGRLAHGISPRRLRQTGPPALQPGVAGGAIAQQVG